MRVIQYPCPACDEPHQIELEEEGRGTNQPQHSMYFDLHGPLGNILAIIFMDNYNVQKVEAVVNPLGNIFPREYSRMIIQNLMKALAEVQEDQQKLEEDLGRRGIFAFDTSALQRLHAEFQEWTADAADASPTQKSAPDPKVPPKSLKITTYRCPECNKDHEFKFEESLLETQVFFPFLGFHLHGKGDEILTILSLDQECRVQGVSAIKNPRGNIFPKDCTLAIVQKLTEEIASHVKQTAQMEIDSQHQEDKEFEKKLDEQGEEWEDRARRGAGKI